VLIRLGYDIEFDLPFPATMIAMLRVHPSRAGRLLQPDPVEVYPEVEIDEYTDSFGNICTRFVAPAGGLRLFTSTSIEDTGALDPVNLDAQEVPVKDLPPETLRFLLASRYCEVDTMGSIAQNLFGGTPRGWRRVQAVCTWVHDAVTFGYAMARSTKTAMDVYNERAGVCRDFQHLAITFCRCLGIPARYATGYLGDIGVPLSDSPMDFSAWFEAYLGDRWWTFDARHNVPRIGRVLIATGRDAADVAITTSFGIAQLRKFTVVTDEVGSGEAGRQGMAGASYRA
jgi:transglutaminase-like putative cysteine protease